MENESLFRLMGWCNNYFAMLYERVTGATYDGAAITAAFNGKYVPGDVVRIHGGYDGTFDALGEGECYTVKSFDGNTLTLDRDPHTRAPYLLLAYCEPPATFATLADDIAEYIAQAKGRAGLQSESIGGYSYSVAGDGSGWQRVFSDDLAGYRMQAPTRLYYLRGARQWR